MVNPDVAVVILNWNGKVFLEKFLPSVIVHSGNAKIFVADNASTDDSIDFLTKNFPMVSIVRNSSNKGFAGGYNSALKQIKADYYVLLNSDVEVTENWIPPIVSYMQSHTQVAACQPKILDYNQKNKFEYAGACGGFIDYLGYPYCRGRIFNELELDEGQYNDSVPVFWATGACLFVRSKIFWEVDGFDEDFFAHMEEIDLCWRMKNKGQEIYVIPSATVYHVGGGTLQKENPRKTFLNFRNSLITITKNNFGRFLFLKIVARLLLDGVAACKFLTEGRLAHLFAIIKAHWVYFLGLGKTIRKRKRIKAELKYPYFDKCLLNKSIVHLHFLKGVKKYSQIK